MSGGRSRGSIGRLAAGPVGLFLLALLAVAPRPAAAEPAVRDEPRSAPPSPPAAAPSKPSPLAPVREADRHFKMAITLYEEGDLRGALTEFRRAQQIFPSYKVLYNLGTVARELNDWAGALGYYRHYLREGADAIAPERRTLIERQVLELAQRTAELEIVPGDGATEITLDDQPVPLDKLGAGVTSVLANPGRRRVRVTYAGRAPQVKTVEVAAGDHTKVVFGNEAPRLPRPRETARAANETRGGAGASADLSAKALPPKRSGDSGGHAALKSWIVTGLFGAGAVTTALFARQSSDALAHERTRFPANPDNLASLSGRTRNLALAADGLMIASAILTGVSLYFSFSGGDDQRDVALAWRF